MDKEQTKKAIEVMQAYIDGVSIEGNVGYDNYNQVNEPSWQWRNNGEEYRIKPEEEKKPIFDQLIGKRVKCREHGKTSLIEPSFVQEFSYQTRGGCGCASQFYTKENILEHYWIEGEDA